MFRFPVDADMKSRWIDVVCLFPMHKLDLAQLKYWFNTVMKSLKDVFFILAVFVTIIYATGENVR